MATKKNKKTTYTFDLDDNVVGWSVDLSKTMRKWYQAPIGGVVSALANEGFHDTGYMPVGPATGVVRIRGGLGHVQILVQIAPGAHPVYWGRCENDPNAKVYSLAQPYRYILGDYYDGVFEGARHFYAYQPAYNGDVLLYHTNLANTNCKGYNGTGVGWMCLYHSEEGNIPNTDRVRQIDYMVRRASGGEAYNDANMSGTDGPRYYKAMEKPAYLCTGGAWQKKTEKDGFEWTLEEGLWLPVMVADRDHQDSGHSGKHHLTMGDAMDGHHWSYYPHRSKPGRDQRPIAALARGELDGGALLAWFSATLTTVCAGNATEVPEVVPEVNAKTKLLEFKVSSMAPDEVATCAICEEKVSKKTLTRVHESFHRKWYQQKTLTPGKTSVCERCLKKYYVALDLEMMGSKLAPKLSTLYIKADSAVVDIESGMFFPKAMSTECAYCSKIWFVPHTLGKVMYTDSSEHPTRCQNCWTGVDMDDSIKCGLTGHFVHIDHAVQMETDDGETKYIGQIFIPDNALSLSELIELPETQAVLAELL